MMLRLSLPAVLLLISSACNSTGGPVFGEFVNHSPRSILVLPPLDETIETAATYGTLTHVTKPLVDSGYYVFPVAVVDSIMRENGLPTPHEMHGVSLQKLDEIFQPDAVLYLTVTEWGTSYQVLASTTTVSLKGRLVDTKTGTELWQGNASQQQGSGGGGGLTGALVGALVNQVATSVSDPSTDVAKYTCRDMFVAGRRGWLAGPYHPDYEERMQAARENMQAKAAQAVAE